MVPHPPSFLLLLNEPNLNIRLLQPKNSLKSLDTLHGFVYNSYHLLDKSQVLEHLREMIADKRSYVLFNNITMYDDALRFANLLGGENG